MNFLKNNISWMAPTAALLLVATGYVGGGDGLKLFQNQGGETARTEQAPAPVPQTEPRVERLTASVEAALEPQSQSAVPRTDTEVVAALQAAQSQSVQEEVTRNAPVDLLTVAPVPKPAAVQRTPAPELDTESAADFFNSAQSNLAVANACGEDLRALAAQARIYFPAGASAGEEAGFNAARLIGIVARDCPGYSIQVEGHSDPSGDPRTNLTLSEKRAEAVISRLAASGIDTSNFFAVGFGDTRPSNVRGPNGNAYYDRRVEFSVVESAQRVSFSAQPTPWQPNVSACAADLDQKAQQMRQFYSPGSITVPTNDLEAVFQLAAEVSRCDGARLRLVGQHSDEPGTREDVRTGRLRALAMMSSLVAAGLPGDQIIIGAPSYSVNVPGQPGLPNSRIDFQVISD